MSSHKNTKVQKLNIFSQNKSKFTISHNTSYNIHPHAHTIPTRSCNLQFGYGIDINIRYTRNVVYIIRTRPVPIEGKSSVCLICMKYRIILLIIIIISMGKISLSYIANTSRTHAVIGTFIYHFKCSTCIRTCTGPFSHFIPPSSLCIYSSFLDLRPSHLSLFSGSHHLSKS